MFDFEDIFIGDFVDYRFIGSISINKVLPVVALYLIFTNLEAQNGTMAIDTWGRLVLNDNFEGDKELIRKNLIDNCKLDTLAMVDTYQFLGNLNINRISNNI